MGKGHYSEEATMFAIAGRIARLFDKLHAKYSVDYDDLAHSAFLVASSRDPEIMEAILADDAARSLATFDGVAPGSPLILSGTGIGSSLELPTIPGGKR